MSPPIRYILLIFVLAITFNAWSGDPNKPKGNNGDQQAKAEQRGTEKTPIFVKADVTTKQDKEESERNAKESELKAIVDKALVKYTLWIALFTLCLFIAAAIQVGLFVWQLRLMNKSTKDSGIAATAAMKSAQVAEDALVIGHRAFVFPVGLGQFWGAIPGTNLYNWNFRVNWKNSGDTPTKHLIIHSKGILSDTVIPDDFDFNYLAQEEDTVTGLIAPHLTLQGNVVPAYPAPNISPQDILDIQAGIKYFYIFGWAKYFDVFPNTRQHITRFCWLISPIGNPITFKPESPHLEERLTFNYIYNLKGNCADEECDNPPPQNLA